MAQLNFYIGERFNPQLSKPYFKLFGQLTKKAAAAKTNVAYGSMTLKAYATEAEYLAAIERLQNEGCRIY